MEAEKRYCIEIKQNNMESDIEVIPCPLKGNMISLEEIKDGDISTGILGQGFGVIPKEGVVRAPFDGTILSLFPTFHAIGIGADNGMQLLIHVGIRTSELQGKFFIPLVKQGDRVNRNEQILRFDLETIKSMGYDVTTAVVITNPDRFENIRFVMI